MKKKLFLFILPVVVFLLVFIGCKTSQSTGDGEELSPPDEFDQLLNYMRNQFQANGVPGGVVAVITNGTLSYSSGVGVKRHGSDDAVNEYTLFFPGSTGKMLTAAAIMTLVEEGTVILDAAVTGYVPYFQLMQPFDPSGIRVHHLLTHTAGLPDVVDLDCNTDSGALSRWFREHPDYPLWSPPGRLWNYSNMGFSLAGLVLEEVSGIPYADAMRQRIFNPLEMTGATYNTGAVIASGNYAVGHTFQQGGEVDQYIEPGFYDCGMASPAGLFYAGVLDMAHFVEMLLANGGNVLTPDSAARMMAPLEDTHFPGENGYGYGLWEFAYKGLTVVRHSGGIDGFRADVCFVPDHNFGVVVMVNTDIYAPHNVSKKAMDIFFDLPDTSPPDYSTPPDTWGKYTGTYFDPYFYGEITVYQDAENRLWVEYGDYDYTTELFQYGDDVFYYDMDESAGSTHWLTVTFFPDDNGIPEYFVTRAGVGKRVENNSGIARIKRCTLSKEEWKKTMRYHAKQEKNSSRW